VPFIAHPVGVALILQEMGCHETVVAAGLLHDTVEDTSVTPEEIRKNFGDEVALIVAGCTEPPKKRGNWERRKMHLIRTLTDASMSVKLVAAADKYHNLSHTLQNLRSEGNSVWGRFGRGPGQQAWYYRTVLVSILAHVPDPESYPIFGQLSDVIDELFERIPSEVP
jgi:(p)ppGpp synthase/HD superfamily hydrolase